jgi:hypothetical protein
LPYGAYLADSEAVAVGADAVHDCGVVLGCMRKGEKSAGLGDTADLSVAGSGLVCVIYLRLGLATEWNGKYVKWEEE